jgi:hypothetical protein
VILFPGIIGESVLGIFLELWKWSKFKKPLKKLLKKLPEGFTSGIGVVIGGIGGVVSSAGVVGVTCGKPLGPELAVEGLAESVCVEGGVVGVDGVVSSPVTGGVVVSTGGVGEAVSTDVSPTVSVEGAAGVFVSTEGAAVSTGGVVGVAGGVVVSVGGVVSSAEEILLKRKKVPATKRMAMLDKIIYFVIFLFILTLYIIPNNHR